MPVLTKGHLAMKLQQNWLAKHPAVEQLTNGQSKDALDDSLTSLNWLHNLNIMNIGTPTPPTSPGPNNDAAKERLKVNPNQVMGTNFLQNNPMMDPMLGFLEAGPPTTAGLERIDYKNNPYVKPPYSYATLICMAMKESRKTKITLSAIYNWITDNFMYYRMADPSWQVGYQLVCATQVLSPSVISEFNQA